MTTDPRAAALAMLLARPDPPDLRPRRHVWTQAGKPGRHAAEVWRLANAYLQYRIADQGELVEVFVRRDCDGLATWVEWAG